MAMLVWLGSSFFHHVGYVIDGSSCGHRGYIFVSLCGEERGWFVGCIVNLWRVIRVVESVFELSDEAIEAQIPGIVCQFEVLKEENMRLLEVIYEDKGIEMLKEDLDKCRDGRPYIN
ncbi:hypothetical protein E2542_SST08563 [Spatholobus suberectus]|nr:hypothetical protein E2542_SST08563 [Spatholobus suberectus]